MATFIAFNQYSLLTYGVKISFVIEYEDILVTCGGDWSLNLLQLMLLDQDLNLNELLLTFPRIATLIEIKIA